MTKFQTPYNREKYLYHDNVSGKSMTVPDQGMTVQQMLRRFASGMPVNARFKDAQFDSDTGMAGVPDISKLDLVDQQEAKQYVANRIKELQNQAAREEQENKDKKFNEAVEKATKLIQSHEQAPAGGSAATT